MAYFLERIDLLKGGRLPLSGGPVSIGRSPGNTFVLTADDRCVSAYHAVIYADPQRMLLQDLQSTNGTFVNGRRVHECILEAGDEIGLGRSGPKFRVAADDGGIGVNDVNGVNGINRMNGMKSINTINSINNVDSINDINHIDNININDSGDVNSANNIGNIDAIDPDASIDAALTGIAMPPPRSDDGEDERSPMKRRFIIAAAIIAFAAVLAAIAMFALIRALSSPTPSTPKESAAGKDFFSAASIPTTSTIPTATPTTTSTQTSISASTPTSTTRDRIDAVLARFGEEEYRAPPEMVERVEYYLDLYKGAMRGTVALWMQRGRRYFPMIRAVFSEKNIPLELAYVSMLESGFNTQAVSPAGAVGMWQFMPQTARRYGLRVGGGVDERTDPEKATRAAAASFKDLIAIFGSRSSTLLCMAAYNAGEQRVINALKRIDDPVRDRDFWYLYRMGWLARETNEYIPQVIALIIISDNPGEYGFDGY
jgi:soluble lytic murein transglycosylase-like protein/pSer/pThr/pTyr-binding forkhead associated (FHA) protein